MQNQQNISLKDTTEMICEECQHNVFTQAFFLRKVSRFVTGAIEDGVIPVNAFACIKCGHINKEFLPPIDI